MLNKRLYSCGELRFVFDQKVFMYRNIRKFTVVLIVCFLPLKKRTIFVRTILDQCSCAISLTYPAVWLCGETSLLLYPIYRVMSLLKYFRGRDSANKDILVPIPNDGECQGVQDLAPRPPSNIIIYSVYIASIHKKLYIHV